MDALKEIYQYPDFSEADLEKIFQAHEKCYINKGDRFLTQGSVLNKYYCLKSGLARAYVIDYTGEEITTNFFGTDEIVIDVVSLFQRTPAKENLQALTDCICWKIGYEAFQDLFRTIEPFPEWGRSWMADNLFECKRRSISIITDSATDRYLALQKQYPEILQQAPLKHVATYLGITDTSLSRIRRMLSEKK